MLALAAAFSGAAPARAGDLAHREILGFSPSGYHFAFEEYGVQDGSGFPYANIYVVDTRTDSWVSGTPVRVMDEDETASLEETRDEALEDAAGILDSADISVPGNHVASNPVTELSADAHRVTVNPRNTVRPIGDTVTLALTEFPLDGGGNCANQGQTMGFSVTIQGGGAARTLHKDDSLPESRGCALGYRIADVVTHYPGKDAPVIAILILVRKAGFEGPDGRWLAVTGRLD